jgi:hypothetical protein
MASENVQQLHDELTLARRGICTQLSFEFLRPAYQLMAYDLIQSNEAELVQRLENIMMTAMEIAGKLGTQRSRLELGTMSNLPEKFDANSRDMQEHTYHHPELDDDEKYLDGKDVLLVVHPAVYAIGSSDGSDRTERRILKKAVVWMGKPSD